MSFHKVAPQDAQDSAAISAEGAQERLSIPCFVEDVLVYAEIKKKTITDKY